MLPFFRDCERVRARGRRARRSRYIAPCPKHDPGAMEQAAGCRTVSSAGLPYLGASAQPGDDWGMPTCSSSGSTGTAWLWIPTTSYGSQPSSRPASSA